VGEPLKEFGFAFRNLSFAESFSPGFENALDSFNALIRFNRIDWSETRDAMVTATEPLRSSDTSEAGQWALVYILQATAAIADATIVDEIVGKLTKGRETFERWNIKNTWCASDPCDPNASRPDNIDKTAQHYGVMKVAQLYTQAGLGSEFHVFEGARPGLARFEPQAAIATMRRFAEDVLSRNNSDFRTAVRTVKDHTAALDIDMALRFATRANQIAGDVLADGDKHKQLFIASEHALMVAFPHMLGDAQLATLLALPRINNVLVSTCELLRACDPNKYETALEVAYTDGDLINQFRLMVFSEYTETKISARAKEIIGKLSTSGDKMVRLCAIRVVLRLAAPDLVSLFVKSD
jgi:hypothetical protein